MGRVIVVDEGRGTITLDFETFKDIIVSVVDVVRGGGSMEEVWFHVNLWLNRELVEGIEEGLRDLKEGNYVEYDPKTNTVKFYSKGKLTRKIKVRNEEEAAKTIYNLKLRKTI